MDPALREFQARAIPAAELEAIVKLTKTGMAPPDLHLVTRFGDIATCRLPAERIAEVWADEAVLSLKAPRLVSSEPEDSEAFTETPSTRQNTSPYSGQGVVVASVDWGFDFTHPNFLNADGSTRFRAIWDQTAPTDASASRYGYGNVYDREQINRALQTANPFETLGYHPAIGDPDESGAHGTHVLDIAAGNGAVGEKGMAPRAELIGVHLSAGNTEGLATLGDSVRILEALDFIASEANGLPVVINLSVGKHGGAHQGNSLVEQGMDQFLREKPGRAIVNSAGNYYDAQVHTSGRVPAGGRTTFEWLVDKSDRTPNELEIWYSHRDALRLHLTMPGMEQAPVQVDLNEKQDLISAGKIVGRAYHRANEPNTGDHHIDIFLYRNAPKGNWQVALEGLDVVDGRFHAWIERDSACRDCQSKFADHDADPNFTTGSICNGLYTIAAGAYDPRDPARAAALYSSAGPTVDGRKKPNLLAPGTGIRAARSAPAAAARSKGQLCVKSGTSMAAPHVTGAIALLFEAAGQPLPIETTRRLLLSSLDPTPKNLGRDLYRYGEGYLNVPAIIQSAAHFAQHQPSFAMKNTPVFNGETFDDQYNDETRFEDYDYSSPADSYESFAGDMHERYDEATDYTAGAQNSYATEYNAEPPDAEWESEPAPCGCHKTKPAVERHLGQHADCRACGEYRLAEAEALIRAGNANLISNFGGGRANGSESIPVWQHSKARQGTTALFDQLALGKPSLYAETRQLTPVVMAMPKSPLPRHFLPGDVLLQRSFGEGKVWQSVIVDGQLMSREMAHARGLSVPPGKPGAYLEVVSGNASADYGARRRVIRVGDAWGRLLGDNLVLRTTAPSGEDFPEYNNWTEAEPKLKILHRSIANLPLTKKKVTLQKLYNPKDKTFSFSSKDPNSGHAVDFSKLLNEEQLAFRNKYGKLHPTLYDKLKSEHESNVFEIAVWVKIDKQAPLKTQFTDEQLTEMPREIQAYNQWVLSKTKELASRVERLIEKKTKVYGIAPIFSLLANRRQIERIKALPDVVGISLIEKNIVPALADSMTLSKANTVVNTMGIKGDGISVAVWEEAPDITTDLIIEGYYDSAKPKVSQHARLVSGIIKNTSTGAGVPNGYAPECKLYSANSFELGALEWALGKTWGAILNKVECSVINGSFQSSNEKNSPFVSTQDMVIDHAIIQYPYPFIALAAGNINFGSGETANAFVSHKGYNAVKVANHLDNYSISADSVFRNPFSLSGDRELPEIAANGDAVSAVASTMSGTSFASPAVAGAAALLQSAQYRLKYWPEGTRAILLAGSTRNVSGDKWHTDLKINKIDAKDGAGALNVEESIKIAQQYQDKNNTAIRRGWGRGAIDDSDFKDRDAVFEYRIKVPPTGGTHVKAALAWDKIGDSSSWVDAIVYSLPIDLDISIFRNGRLVASSASFDNSYEIAEFDANHNDELVIKIRKWAGSGWTYYGIAWNVY